MSCYFTKIFVHLPVIAAVCNFIVYKLIILDPENIYLLKLTAETLGKCIKYAQNLQ